MSQSKRAGCLWVLFALILLFALYQVSLQAAYRFSKPARTVITWPSQWGCDEFNEAYKVVQVESPNSLIRWLHGNEQFIVTYPAGRYRDTTQFHRYYAHLVRWRQEDTVVVSGRFDNNTINVGEPSGMYQCDPIPYFKVQNIYSKNGKLLKRFP
jgi:hypothetical protein